MNMDAPPSQERRLRTEVAICTRVMVTEGVLGYSGHVSARLPGERFLVQSFDQSRETLTPDDLLVCDRDGGMIEGGGCAKPPSEVSIHAEILKARPDVGAVAHFHYDTAVLFTLVRDRPLLIVKNHAVRWRSGVPVHPDPSHVVGEAMGRALAERLGPHHALQIRGHGQVLVAENPRALLIDAIHFKENADVLFRAGCLGEAAPLTDADLDAFERDFDRARHVGKLWRFYVGRALAAGAIPPAWGEAEDGETFAGSAGR